MGDWIWQGHAAEHTKGQSVIETMKASHIAGEGDDEREKLYDAIATGLSMVAKNQIDLEQLNQLGIYHRFNEVAAGSFDVFQAEKRAPTDWVSRGRYAGIWCSFFDPRNTGPLSKDSIIGQFTFCSGFKAFDPDTYEHQQSYNNWLKNPENRNRRNIWTEQKNSEGVDMSERVEAQLFAPGHARFYKDNNFGAIVGRHYHAGLVVVDADLIANVQRLQILG